MALTADRDTPRYGSEAVPDDLSLPMAANTTCYRGGVVALNRSGYAVPASADITLVVVGVGAQKVVNGSVAGDSSIKVERGAFGLANSSGDDLITSEDVMRPCFLVDDQTVARTSAMGTRPIAGRVMRVEDGRVFVELGVSEDPSVRELLIEAGGDLSALINTFVKVNSSGQAVAASAAGESCRGVLMNAPASGAVAIVRTNGPARVLASASINPGVDVATTIAGLTKAAVAASVKTDDAGVSADAVSGSFVMGWAMTAGTNGNLHSVFLHPMGAIPTTAA